MSDRIRAVALGYQGFGNVGDEAILAGLEAVLAGSRVVVATVIGGPGPIPAFPGAQRIVTRRMRPNLAALRALRRSRLVILSGGGLLHDHWWTVVPTYLAWVVLARLSGARVAWAGVGIGPLRGRLTRLLAGWALRLSRVVTVRDVDSAALAASIAPHIRVTVVPDPAFVLPAPAPGERHGVGYIVRGPTPSRRSEAGSMVAGLGEAVSRTSQSGQPVSIVTFGGSADRAFAEAVAERAAENGAASSLVELGPDPSRAAAMLAGLEAVVSVRLHGIILAVVAGTPVVPVTYDDKVAAIARQLGLADATVSSASITSHAIAVALGTVREQGVRAEVARRLADIRIGSATLRSLLEQAGS